MGGEEMGGCLLLVQPAITRIGSFEPDAITGLELEHVTEFLL
jgi:hypothetical protein